MNLIITDAIPVTPKDAAKMILQMVKTRWMKERLKQMDKQNEPTTDDGRTPSKT